MAAKSITFSSGEKWENTILFVRNLERAGLGKGFRLYWAPDNEARFIVGDDGECSAKIFRTERECIAHGMRKYSIKARRMPS